jgi:hypothetical protein
VADVEEPGPAVEEPFFGRRVHVALPTWMSERLDRDEVALTVRGHRPVARVVRVVVPVVAMVAGAVLAVGGAVLAEREATEAVGTLATELGAAVLFAGAVLLVVSRVPTVGRVVVLVASALAGAVAVVAALAFGWEGAALSLAMELGVAAVALLVIDVVLMGLVFPRLDELASGPERAVVSIRLRPDRAGEHGGEPDGERASERERVRGDADGAVD